MNELLIKLDDDAYKRLAERAQRNRRDPRDEAALIVERALLEDAPFAPPTLHVEMRDRDGNPISVSEALEAMWPEMARHAAGPNGLRTLPSSNGERLRRGTRRTTETTF